MKFRHFGVGIRRGVRALIVDLGYQPDRLVQTNTVHIFDPILVEISSFQVFKVFKAARFKPLNL